MAVLYPGATPQHTFKLPFLAADCSLASVSYRQAGKTLITKTTETFTVSESDTSSCTITISFSQAETLRFDDNKEISAQINLMTVDNKRHPSVPIVIKAGEQYERKVIGNG